jgi:hypothetical protein
MRNAIALIIQYAPLKRRPTSARQHGATFHKAVIFLEKNLLSVYVAQHLSFSYIILPVNFLCASLSLLLFLSLISLSSLLFFHYIFFGFPFFF